MRALVVYESLFGNTGQVAQAIATGLSEAADGGDDVQVSVVSVGQAPRVPPEALDLLVLGGPTHAFSLTRPGTREGAHRQGAPAAPRWTGESSGGTATVETGLREWLDQLPFGHRDTRVATFDTRITKVRRLPGSAARKAARLVRAHGYPVCAPPNSFYVDDVAGPLADGELARAREWGRALGALPLP